MNLAYSFIIPVYNRPIEIRELLDSFHNFSSTIPFEIVIIEDGSSITSLDEVNLYKKKLNISYYYKENSGPGDSRNFGMSKAKGNYFIILDSDVILPKNYLQEVDDFLKAKYVDCFGGPDGADKTFSPIQKAINFVMTSFLTTGGIRGKEKSVKKYEPRSFNMGISKKAFEKTKGFSKIHPGEDPDLSIRIYKENMNTAFIKKAMVFHKRRIDWKKFFIQVNKFGKVRPILNNWHPTTASVVFWFPSLFVIYTIMALLLLFFKLFLPFILLLIYIVAICLFSSIKNKSILIGILTIKALFIQFFGYGMGFLVSTYYIKFRRKKPKKIFPELFFN